MFHASFHVDGAPLYNGAPVVVDGVIDFETPDETTDRLFDEIKAQMHPGGEMVKGAAALYVLHQVRAEEGARVVDGRLDYSGRTQWAVEYLDVAAGEYRRFTVHVDPRAVTTSNSFYEAVAAARRAGFRKHAIINATRPGAYTLKTGGPLLAVHKAARAAVEASEGLFDTTAETKAAFDAAGPDAETAVERAEQAIQEQTAYNALEDATDMAARAGYTRWRVLRAVKGEGLISHAGYYIGSLVAVNEAAKKAPAFHLDPASVVNSVFDSVVAGQAAGLSITAVQINALHFYSLAISDASRSGVSAVDIETLSRGGAAGPGGSTCEFVWETAQGLIDAGLDVEAVMDALK